MFYLRLLFQLCGQDHQVRSDIDQVILRTEACVPSPIPPPSDGHLPPPPCAVLPTGPGQRDSPWRGGSLHKDMGVFGDFSGDFESELRFWEAGVFF